MRCPLADALRSTGSQTQKGITSYALSANRQRPLAGTANAAIFNTWRRFRAQALYVIPPFALAYLAMNWAIEKYVVITPASSPISYVERCKIDVDGRNEYLNSKEGRYQDPEESDAARQGGSVRG